MKKFVIVSDSCCDLNEELRKKYDIEYIPMGIAYNGKSTIADLDWKEISVKDYYQMMKDDIRVTTFQITKEQYLSRFEEYLKNGYDILSISCSSALSASVHASYKARDELLAKYPESKIICIDSLISCYGLGLLCIIASNMRSEGKQIEEVAKFIEENKLKSNQFGTVADLKYIKRAGRITATKALFGTLFNVKPIIISDIKGQNVSVEKSKGRKNVISRMAELTKEYTDKMSSAMASAKRGYVDDIIVICDEKEISEQMFKKISDGFCDRNMPVNKEKTRYYGKISEMTEDERRQIMHAECFNYDLTLGHEDNFLVDSEKSERLEQYALSHSFDIRLLGYLYGNHTFKVAQYYYFCNYGNLIMKSRIGRGKSFRQFYTYVLKSSDRILKALMNGWFQDIPVDTINYSNFISILYYFIQWEMISEIDVKRIVVGYLSDGVSYMDMSTEDEVLTKSIVEWDRMRG